MTEPNVAKTTPLTEKTATPSDLTVTFTPVDVPTRQVDEVIKVFATGPLGQSVTVAARTYAEPLHEFTAVGALTCHACGSTSDGEDLFCLTCGEFLEANGGQDETLTGGAIAEAGGVPACGDCGAETTEGEVFCLACGAVVE